jgi:predicted nucleotidyltransferase
LLNFIEELNLYYLPPRYPDLYEQIKNYYSLKNMKKVFKLDKTLFLWLRNYPSQKFGSVAKGKIHQDSDIDLIILSSDFERIDFMKRLILLSKIRRKLKKV